MYTVPITKSVIRITTPYEKRRVVFLYLIQGDKIALVDTGTTNCPRQVLQPALAEVGLALSNIDLILNTHVHLDHTGGNLETKRASNATIHVHAADASWARSTETMVE